MDERVDDVGNPTSDAEEEVAATADGAEEISATVRKARVSRKYGQRTERVAFRSVRKQLLGRKRQMGEAKW